MSDTPLTPDDLEGPEAGVPSRRPGERLRNEFNMTGILTQSSDLGGAPEILCDMDFCYCPLGRDHFIPLSGTPDPWNPTEDHYPKPKMWGGNRVPGNIRLAHRRCNQLDPGWSRGHIKQRFKAAAQTVRWHSEYADQSAANASRRGRAHQLWLAMRARANG